MGILVDDFTRKSWVLFLRTKDQYFDKMKTWLQQAENEAGVKMAHLHVDGGGEFVSQAMATYIADRGATLEFSALYTPEHNSVAEQCW